MKKILVVDDNKNTTDVVEAMLESMGHDCTRAHSGRECIELIGKNQYDLILLDVAMPDTTGVDVVNRLKKDGLLAKNKVVFFTASSQSDDEIKDLQRLGVLGYMKKPFTKAELLAVVSKHA